MNGLLRTRFELTSPGGRDYDGEIHSLYLSDRMRLADIRFSLHFTRPKAGRPERQKHHTFLVSYQAEGHARVRRGRREADIGPNQIFFIETAQPFKIETDEVRTR